MLDKRGRLRGKHAAAVDIWHIHSNFKPNSKHIKMLFNTFCPAFLKCFVVGSLLGPILIYLRKRSRAKGKNCRIKLQKTKGRLSVRIALIEIYARIFVWQNFQPFGPCSLVRWIFGSLALWLWYTLFAFRSIFGQSSFCLAHCWISLRFHLPVPPIQIRRSICRLNYTAGRHRLFNCQFKVDQLG